MTGHTAGELSVYLDGKLVASSSPQRSLICETCLTRDKRMTVMAPGKCDRCGTEQHVQELTGGDVRRVVRSWRVAPAKGVQP